MIASIYVILRSTTAVGVVAVSDTTYRVPTSSGFVLDSVLTIVTTLVVSGCWIFVAVSGAHGNPVGWIVPAFATGLLIVAAILIMFVTAMGSQPPAEIIPVAEWLGIQREASLILLLGAVLVTAILLTAPFIARPGPGGRRMRMVYGVLVGGFALYGLVPAIWLLAIG